MTSSPSNLAQGQGTISDQIQGLIDRGMDVSNRDYAVRCLTHIGFHRLVSYWRPLQAGAGPNAGFRPGTSFSLLMTRYMFDQRFRSLLLEALSYIEISIRNQWSYHLVRSSASGEFAHLDAGLFNPKYYGGNSRELEKSYNTIRGKSGPGFHSARIWDVVPTMSFGSLSKWYSSLNDRATRQSIASSYGVDEVVLRSVLKYLTSVRNACAHHERVWNLTIEPGLKIPRELGGSKEAVRAFNSKELGKVYNALIMIIHLMEVITPNGSWPERLIAFMESTTYQSMPRRSMGFPTDWREFAIWKRHMPQGDAAESST
jgi:abortive infection bacteriophage resistance protein